jgi:hypothetical protein
MFILLVTSASAAFAQCAENNYIQDGAPSSQRDCQPFASLKQLVPEAMSSADQQTVADRRGDLAQGARFYGFDIGQPGWTYKQAISPLLQKHILLLFTNATPLSRASHFTAIVPEAGDQRVQVVPAFSHGLRPYLPGWQTKGTFAVFNRTLSSERGSSEHGARPISRNSDWIQYAVLYLTLVGRDSAVPTETDSVKANWDLSVKRGTTPVIFLAKNGAATIAFSDLTDPGHTANWTLIFDKRGQILKAERTDRSPGTVRYMQTEAEKNEAVPSQN